MAIIKLKNVSKAHRNNDGVLQVLDNINLEVNDGEFVCVVGPSGCGKSTLLNIIAGLDRADSGEVLCDGGPISDTGPDRLLIFQDLGLFPWLNVEENVMFGLNGRKISLRQKREIADKYLRMVNLSRFRNCCLHELSGGMKQRLAISRALAVEPRILLMDEPFASLDAQSRDMLHVELQSIWNKTGKTVIFVTHNIREAVCLGDKVVTLSAQPARIKKVFPVDLKRPRHIEDSGLMEIVRTVLGELKDEIDKTFSKEFDGKTGA